MAGRRADGSPVKAGKTRSAPVISKSGLDEGDVWRKINAKRRMG